MGASAREIEREIRRTRDRIDDNLTQLEGNAATRAARYARFAAVGAGVLAAAGLALVIYRRRRKPSLRERLDDVSLDGLRAMLERLKEDVPSVTVRVNDKSRSEPGVLESIIREMAPTILGTASSALIQRVARPSGPGRQGRATQTG